MKCGACEADLPEVEEPAIIASGGWCAPSMLLYDDFDWPRVCGACQAAMALGISRDTLDAITTVRRGGITFNYPRESNR
jgi:hypothetical protein